MDDSPPGTPAKDRKSKRPKLKAGVDSKDFTKVGLFCGKEGTHVADFFPANLLLKNCSFFYFHDKKCAKAKTVCEIEHINEWDKIPPPDERKILEHFHASGEKLWLDADTFMKHKITNIPEKYAYLLGDAKGPKGA